MGTPDRIARVETALRAACERVRADGVELVSGAFEVIGESRPDVGPIIGVCAWGAHNMYPEATDAELEAEEYDAIEEGWDSWMTPGGMRTRKPFAWFALGARLAAEFQPVPANSLEAA